MVVAGETRAQKLSTLVRGMLDSVPDGVLILPTFSYSFCRDEPFDVEHTPSAVGVLPEYFRQLPQVRRTPEPIFSTAVHGHLPPAWERRLFAVGDKDCFGDESVFALLLEADAKLVFLGVAPTACTFIHHVEQSEGVAYRYFKEFRGLVRRDGASRRVTARYYVRDLDSDVETFLVPLVDALRAGGALAELRFPRGPELGVTRARAIGAAAVAGLQTNASFLLERGHPHLAHLRYA